MRRATIAMKRTWSIGEEIFKEDYRRRVMMFESLVGSVALFGAEVWGWINENRLDKIKRKYVKWILNLDARTPNYILIEETKMKELRIQAIKRAITYEEKACLSRKRIVKECIKDVERDRPKMEEGGWERRRREELERAGISKAQMRNEREAGNVEMLQTFLERTERREKEERRQRVNESRYNNYYKRIITEGIPKYLEGRKKGKDRSLIARYRCGNETRGSQHWREEEDRKCRICGEEEENLAHILKECETTKSETTFEDFIGEEGKGLDRMKEIERARQRKKKDE